jgi:hypothetical protein
LHCAQGLSGDLYPAFSLYNRDDTLTLIPHISTSSSSSRDVDAVDGSATSELPSLDASELNYTGTNDASSGSNELLQLEDGVSPRYFNNLNLNNNNNNNHNNSSSSSAATAGAAANGAHDARNTARFAPKATAAAVRVTGSSSNSSSSSAEGNSSSSSSTSSAVHSTGTFTADCYLQRLQRAIATLTTITTASRRSSSGDVSSDVDTLVSAVMLTLQRWQRGASYSKRIVTKQGLPLWVDTTAEGCRAFGLQPGDTYVKNRYTLPLHFTVAANGRSSAKRMHDHYCTS